MKQALTEIALFLFALLIITSAQAGNLLVGGDMESEGAWNITDFPDNGSVEYDFGFTGDSLAFGYGGCLRIYQGEDMGQLLLWQRVTLIGGQKYRATGAIKLLDHNLGDDGGGTWYQMYISEEEVDEASDEYNPSEDMILDVGDGFGRAAGFFDNLWEAVNLNHVVKTTPYYIAPGAPGEEVEVTVGVKVGQYWPDYTDTYFEVLIDEVGLYAVEEAVNAGGDMESEDGWNITDFKDNGTVEYDFGYTVDSLAFGHGGSLHIYQGEDTGQLLIWQRVTLIAGQRYRATGALTLFDFNLGPAGGGNWYQMYIDPEEVDETADEYNPGEIKFMDTGEGWDRSSDYFDSLWEVVNLSTAFPAAPYYIPEGTPGEEVEVTFAIKFGQYWPDYTDTYFEILVDEVYLLSCEEGSGTAVKDNPVNAVQSFDLAQNYPNPFNPTTTIEYSLHKTAKVRLTVYDLLGHEVATLVDENQSQGVHSVTFDASDLANGIYFYKLEAAGHMMTKKLTLIK